MEQTTIREAKADSPIEMKKKQGVDENKIVLSELSEGARLVLKALDKDKDGSVDIKELQAAVLSLVESRKRVKWLFVALIVVLLILSLMCVAVGGIVWYVILTTRQVNTPVTNSGSPALTNLSGSTLRIAVGSMSGLNIDFVDLTTTQPVANVTVNSAGTRVTGTLRRRLEGAPSASFDPDMVYDSGPARHARYLLAGSGHHGLPRHLFTVPENARPAHLMALLPPTSRISASVAGSVAISACSMLAEGHQTFLVPYKGSTISAYILTSTTYGCANFSSEYGFTTDFTWESDAAGSRKTGRISCTSPLTSNSTCSVYDVFRSIIPPQIPTSASLPSTGAVVPAASGRWSSMPSTPFYLNRAACNYGSGLWQRDGVTPIDQPVPIPTGSARDNLIQSCVTLASQKAPVGAVSACFAKQSYFSQIGLGFLASNVFPSRFWANATSLTQEVAANPPVALLPNNTELSLLLDNNSPLSALTKPTDEWLLGGSCMQGFTSSVALPGASLGASGASATSYSFPSVPFTGNVVEDVRAISDTCANACDVLQWYTFWRSNYFIDGVDYCSNAAYGGGASWGVPYQGDDGRWVAKSYPSAMGGACGGGMPVPVCISPTLETTLKCLHTPIPVSSVSNASSTNSAGGALTTNATSIAQELNTKSNPTLTRLLATYTEMTDPESLTVMVQLEPRIGNAARLLMNTELLIGHIYDTTGMENPHEPSAKNSQHPLHHMRRLGAELHTLTHEQRMLRARELYSWYVNYLGWLAVQAEYVYNLCMDTCMEVGACRVRASESGCLEWTLLTPPPPPPQHPPPPHTPPPKHSPPPAFPHYPPPPPPPSLPPPNKCS